MLNGEITEFGDFSLVELQDKKARGGAGSIWEIKNQQNFVAKIYHENIDTAGYEAKVDAMLLSRPNALDAKNTFERFPAYTWPITKLTESNKFVGYVMPKLDFSKCVSLERFLNKKSRLVDNLSDFVGNRHLIAHNLASAIDSIHAAEHLVVDLKPQNLIVERKKYLISVLDTDGFAIASSGRVTYPAKQFTPEYIAPEFINKLPHQVTIQQDYFALAVIIFRLFNNGIHPFQAGMKRSNKTINEMVKRKYYAYGLTGDKGLIPSRFSEHQAWPKDLREAFDQAFKSKRRPSGADWTSILGQFNPSTSVRAKTCSMNVNHVRLDNRCPQCELIENSQRISFETQQRISKKQKRKISSQVKNQQVSTQNNCHKKTILKRNLIKKAFCVGTGVYITFSLGWYFFSDANFELIEWLKFRFDTNLTWSLAYIFSLSILYYRANRGHPNRDCPGCGAYANSLKFLKSEKDFVRWRHQTKAGLPDRRYKLNPKLFEMKTYWECKYCDSELKFIHDLSATPRKTSVNITHKHIL